MNLNELSKQDREKLIEAMEVSEKDPIEWINRFVYTFNPRTPPYRFEFNLYSFQENLVRELQNAINKGYDIFIDKTRDMGVTYTVLATFLWYWRYEPGSNFHIGSRKEDLVDNTTGVSGESGNKEESLFGKIEYMLKNLIPIMLPSGFRFRDNLTFMSLTNPEIGNVISGESANPDFSRGGRYKAVLLDEYAFWSNDAAVWGATRDSTNCRIVVTTPGTKPGKAKRLRFGRDGEKIKVISLSWRLHPLKDEAWYAHEKEVRSKEDLAREVDMNWEASMEGRVYEEIKYADVNIYPYEPKWPLLVSWDFGLDGVAIGWWQPNPENNKMRLVDSYYNEDESIYFYLPFFPGNDVSSEYEYKPEDIALTEKVKKYKRAIHYGDPDVNKRAIQTKHPVKTKEILEEHGIYVQTDASANDFQNRWTQTKVMLQRGIEINDTPENDFYLRCIQEARFPKRKEESESTAPIKLPVHDFTSHHRTQTEYLAVNYIGREKEQQSIGKPINAWDGNFSRLYRG